MSCCNGRLGRRQVDAYVVQDGRYCILTGKRSDVATNTLEYDLLLNPDCSWMLLTDLLRAFRITMYLGGSLVSDVASQRCPNLTMPLTR